jgi:hypothetical protein
MTTSYILTGSTCKEFNINNLRSQLTSSGSKYMFTACYILICREGFIPLLLSEDSAALLPYRHAQAW